MCLNWYWTGGLGYPTKTAWVVLKCKLPQVWWSERSWWDNQNGQCGINSYSRMPQTAFSMHIPSSKCRRQSRDSSPGPADWLHNSTFYTNPHRLSKTAAAKTRLNAFPIENLSILWPWHFRIGGTTQWQTWADNYTMVEKLQICLKPIKKQTLPLFLWLKYFWAKYTSLEMFSKTLYNSWRVVHVINTFYVNWKISLKDHYNILQSKQLFHLIDMILVCCLLLILSAVFTSINTN
jgi:hypothetical protein